MKNLFKKRVINNPPNVTNNVNELEYTFQKCCERMKSESAMNFKDIKKDMRGPFSRNLRDFLARMYNDGKCIFQNEYIAKRFFQSVIWYTKRAQLNKMLFVVFSTITIVLPILSTTLLTISEKLTVVSTIFSAITAIFTAMLTLFKFQYNWLQFRTTSDELQTELSFLISEEGKYSQQDIKAQYEGEDLSTPEKLTEFREKTFLIQIEKIMAKEKIQRENLHKPSK